jgi:hypothetical protein
MHILLACDNLTYRFVCHPHFLVARVLNFVMPFFTFILFHPKQHNFEKIKFGCFVFGPKFDNHHTNTLIMGFWFCFVFSCV